MPERWPRLRCPDCGETEFTDKEWSDRAHICPLYMELTWRGLVARNDGSECDHDWYVSGGEKRCYNCTATEQFDGSPAGQEVDAASRRGGPAPPDTHHDGEDCPAQQGALLCQRQKGHTGSHSFEEPVPLYIDGPNFERGSS